MYIFNNCFQLFIHFQSSLITRAIASALQALFMYTVLHNHSHNFVLLSCLAGDDQDHVSPETAAVCHRQGLCWLGRGAAHVPRPRRSLWPRGGKIAAATASTVFFATALFAAASASSSTVIACSSAARSPKLCHLRAGQHHVGVILRLLNRTRSHVRSHAILRGSRTKVQLSVVATRI
jgi:hypothetical protein